VSAELSPVVSAPNHRAAAVVCYRLQKQFLHNKGSNLQSPSPQWLKGGPVVGPWQALVASVCFASVWFGRVRSLLQCSAASAVLSCMLCPCRCLVMASTRLLSQPQGAGVLQHWSA
jgi:hypothetical protein